MFEYFKVYWLILVKREKLPDKPSVLITIDLKYHY